MLATNEELHSKVLERCPTLTLETVDDPVCGRVVRGKLWCNELGVAVDTTRDEASAKELVLEQALRILTKADGS